MTMVAGAIFGQEQDAFWDAINSANAASAAVAAAISKSNERPRPLFLNGSAVSSSGVALIALDACAADRIWVLRRLVVSAPLWTTALTGTAVAAVTASPQVYTTISLIAGVPGLDVVASFSALPAVVTFSGQGFNVPLLPHQCLVVVTGGVGNGTQVVVGAQFDDWPLTYSVTGAPSSF